MAQTIAAQVAELVGTTAPASIDDWADDAINRLYSLLPYDVLAPYTSIESCNYGSGVSVVAVAQVSSVTPGGTLPTDVSTEWTVVINGTSITTGAIDSPASTASICTAITSAINTNATVNTLVSASDQVTHVHITSTVAGVEFSITSTCDSASDQTLVNSTVTANRETVTAYTELTARNKRIFEVSRRSSAGLHRLCDEISPEQYMGEYADSNSMYYPTAYDPKWTKYTNTIKVLPASADMIVYARTLSDSSGYATSGTSITTLPLNAEYLVVLDLAGRVAQNKIQGLAISSLTDTLIVPSVPTAPAFTYTDVAKSVIMPTTLADLGTVPAYSTQMISGYAVSAASAFDTAMTNEDTELAQAQIAKMNQGMQDYQTKLQNELNRVNIDIQVYQVTLQEAVKQMEVRLQEAVQNAQNAVNVDVKNREQQLAQQIQEYQADLKLFESQIASYGQQLQSKVGIYQSNIQKTKTEMERYLALAASFKQQYYEILSLVFGLQIKGNSNGKQG